MLPLATLFAVLGYNQLWYCVPLIVSISLVYGATRDEEMQPILVHSYRAAVWILSFLATVFVVLLIIAWLV